MNLLIPTPEWMNRLGWVLLHFAWQGAAIGMMSWIGLLLLKKSSPQSRYLFLCGALVSCLFLPCITWTLLSRDNIPPSAAVTGGGLHAITAPPVIALSVEKAVFASFWSIKQGLESSFKEGLPYLVILWSLGVIFLSIRLLYGWSQLQNLYHSGTPIQDRIWVERLKALSESMGIKGTVSFLESFLIEVPSVIGWLRPVILVPATFLTGLPADQIEAILAHELAHIQRHDYLINLIQTALETLFFYHPVVWWISRSIREERENCCDDMALKVVVNKTIYVTALAALEENRSLSMGLTLAITGGSLLQRVKRILGVGGEKKAPWGLLIVLLIIAVSAFMLLHLKNASFYNREAQAKEAKRDWNGAIADYSHAIALDPKNAEIYMLRASAKQKIGNLDGEITDYEMALKIKPNIPGDFLQRGVYKQNKGDFDGAISDYDITIKLASLDKEVDHHQDLENLYLIRASAKEAKGDKEGAAVDFKKAEELKSKPANASNIQNKEGDPKTASEYFNRGNAKALKREYDGAIIDYDKAIELNPKSADCYNSRGCAKAQICDSKTLNSDLDDAIADLTQAIKLNQNLDPKDVNAHITYNTSLYYNNRAVFKSRKGDKDGAISDYTCAITLEPTRSDYYLARAGAKESKNDLTGAMADYNEAIIRSPKYAYIYDARGNLKEKTGDLDGAIADYTQALQNFSKRDVDWIIMELQKRGKAKEAKEDKEGAAADYKRAKQQKELAWKDQMSDLNQKIKLNPQDPNFYRVRARFKDSQKDYDGAIADCNQAIGLDPKNVEAYLRRGFSKEQKKDFTGAIADYTQAIILEPKYAYTYDHRGSLKEKIGDLDGAIADYTQVIQNFSKKDIDWIIRDLRKRGDAKEKKGDKEGAAADFKKEEELKSNAFNAASMQRKGNKLDLKTASGYYKSGLPKEAKGDFNGAAEDLKKAAYFKEMV